MTHPAEKSMLVKKWYLEPGFEDVENLDGERTRWEKLFLSVVLRATEDALTAPGVPAVGGSIKDVDEARAWLTGGSKHFQEVCLDAGLSPEMIRERARKMRDKGWPHQHYLDAKEAVRIDRGWHTYPEVPDA